MVDPKMTSVPATFLKFIFIVSRTAADENTFFSAGRLTVSTTVSRSPSFVSEMTAMDVGGPCS